MGKYGGPSSELVYGDLLVLGEGDAVGADARLVQICSLRVHEASLTGEREAVLKDAATLSVLAGLGRRPAERGVQGRGSGTGHRSPHRRGDRNEDRDGRHRRYAQGPAAHVAADLGIVESGAIALSMLLQVLVVNLAFLNLAFHTVTLTAEQWLRFAAMASGILWFGELRKLGGHAWAQWSDSSARLSSVFIRCLVAGVQGGVPAEPEAAAAISRQNGAASWPGLDLAKGGAGPAEHLAFVMLASFIEPCRMDRSLWPACSSTTGATASAGSQEHCCISQSWPDSGTIRPARRSRPRITGSATDPGVTFGHWLRGPPLRRRRIRLQALVIS